MLRKKVETAYQLLGEILGHLDAQEEVDSSTEDIFEFTNNFFNNIDYGDLERKASDVFRVKGEKMLPKIIFEDGYFVKRKYGWEYRFNKDGERAYIYGKTKEVCYQKRLELISGKREIRRKVAPKHILLYKTWLKEWHKLFNVKKKKEATLKMHELYIERIIKGLGEHPLDGLTGEQIQRFLQKYEDNSNTQHKIAGIIRRSLKKAFELNKIQTNPFALVELDAHEYESYRALTFEEQAKVLEAASDKYRPLLFFSMCTGLRLSEALEVDVESIDFERKQIYAKRKKKRGKSANRLYPVAFDDELFEIVKLPKSGTVFDIKYETIKTYVGRLYKRLNITDATIHSFRHTFSSVCYHVGISDKQIQAWLAHETLAMTTDTYTHLLGNGDSPVRRYINKLKN